jgi:hypothetical protein
MPEQLRQYEPRAWCDDPSDLYQAGYAGIVAYYRARETWFMVERGSTAAGGAPGVQRRHEHGTAVGGARWRGGVNRWLARRQ